MAEHLPRHGRLLIPENYKPTMEQDEIIRAASIGDGCILYPYKGAKNPRLSWNIANKEHAEYICNEFSFLGATIKKSDNGGFGEFIYRITTKVHPLLKKYHKDLYPKGVKTISSEYVKSVSEVFFAWLYADDGHLNKNRGILFIHTEGYSKQESEILAKKINHFIGFEGARIHSYKGGKHKKLLHCIRLTKGATSEFINKIKKYIPDGVEHKTQQDN